MHRAQETEAPQEGLPGHAGQPPAIGEGDVRRGGQEVGGRTGS